MGKEHADPIGLAVARAAQKAVPEATVILFGSRARGDHRKGSDVDLMVVVDTEDTALLRAIEGAAGKAAYRKLLEFPGKFGYDVVGMTRRKLAYCQRARNHIAAQALRDGVIMNEDEFDDFCKEDFADDYVPGWPDIRQRLINSGRWLNSLNHSIDTGLDDQELSGFIAQQAMENALKGWISAIDCEYRNIHHILELAEVIRDNVAEDPSPARAELDAAVEWLALTEGERAELGLRGRDPRDWLSLYAVMYRYGGAEHRLNPDGYRELQERIGQAVRAFAREVYRITGTGPEDLGNGG